jgi:uncharacterized protein (TIGR03437 family)
MESVRSVPSAGSNCPSGGTGRHGRALLPIFALFFGLMNLSAQPAPASVSTRPLALPASLIDAAGNVYTAGIGYGTPSYPVTPGAAQTQPGGGLCPSVYAPVPCSNAYVAKSDANGDLVFGTFLGGQTDDSANAVAVDTAGNVYIVGDTGGLLPTTANAAIATSTTSHVFAAKISADGSSFLYVTYLPGTDATGLAIAVDGEGNAYVAGQTTTGHAFIAKLNAAGSAVLYNIALPGTQVESATGIVVDAEGNAVAAGWTQAQSGGAQNIFVSKVDANGNLVLSTTLGGSGTDLPNAVQLDAGGNIYVAGQTTSLDFPTTPGSFQPTALVRMWNVSPGGFIFKLAANSTALAYSSYVPSLDTRFEGITSLAVTALLAVTASGEAYLAGSAGAGFPVTDSAPQICFGGSTDAFVAHFSPQGILLDATYIGDTNDNTAEAIALANDGSILLAWNSNDSTGSNSFSRIQFGGAGWSPPACLSPDALNAATLHSQGAINGRGVAPGELVTLTGFGIGPAIGVGYQPGEQGQVPVELAGVQVLFDGQPAPLLYVQSQQINAVAPFGLSAEASTNISVIYNGAPIGPVTVPVIFGVPGIFRLQPGVSSQAAALNQDGTLNGRLNPASPGSVVTVWGTGFGATDPGCVAGGLNAPIAANLAPGMSVTLNDLASTIGLITGRSNPALYAGSAPTLLCGVAQINMLVPTYAQGDYLFFPGIAMAIPGGTTSDQSAIGVTIAVK